MALYELKDEIPELISQLCDIALKVGGMSNKGPVDQVLAALVPIKDLKSIAPKKGK